LNLAILIQNNTTNSSTAQQIILPEMRKTGKSAATVIQEKGLAQVSDTGAIEKFCDDAIAANPNSVADYKNGKVAALNFLKGQVMKLSKGKANPNLVGEILERKLKA
jgi:aspartyl-tRNA(Asn)/glutamyl-tRNA(Gln) amidotransferase subunit B